MTIMSVTLLPLLFISLFLLCCVSSSSFLPKDDLVACRPDQIQALMQFKNEFDSRGCNQTSTFNEVQCDNSTGVITKLQLPGCLSGTLKPDSSLFKLHNLRYLNLSQNNFISSSIPSEFGNLNRLEVLCLSSNGFVGQVPSSFSNLSQLNYLDLSQNELTGSFPLLQNLTKLSFLSLEYNHFSGTISPKNSLFEMHHLRYLNLKCNNFSSRLPSEFGNLNKLEALFLSTNDFFGQIPPTIGNLTFLTTLYLDQNKFTGTFPLVQNLTKLSLLVLSFNHFSGTIPSSIITMPFLWYVDLRANNFTGSIALLNSSSSSSLERMFLGKNRFKGHILEPISKLTTLEFLDLSFLDTSHPIDLNLFSSLISLIFLDISGNTIYPASLRSNSSLRLNLTVLTLSGCGIKEFPNILKTLQSLEFLDLSNNRVKGKLPEWLWSLPLLSTMSIFNNSFNGFEGSMEVLVNSSMEMLELDFNSFEGALPNLPLSIIFFSTVGNGFTGEIPLSICKRSSLMYLDLSYNNFTGLIHRCLSNLKLLKLRKNNLEGSIPDAFDASASLQTLDVGHNRLTGQLPRSLQNCSSLQFLDVENNKIKDTFPFWLKVLPKLQVLTLRSNKFYGAISPPHQGPLGFPELRILEISDNKYTGSLPPKYFMNWKASSLTMNEDKGLYMENQDIASRSVSYTWVDRIDFQYKGLHMEQEKVLTSYSAIDFSGNLLEGQIPESIGSLKALIALNLSNNAFTGHIPSSFSNLVDLESLDLSRNQLSGTISKGLGGLSFLAYINVSHNQLTGEIPQGTQITGQPKSSFEENAGLCGLPLEESCFGTKVPPTQQPEEEKEEEEEVLNWRGVAVGYGLGVLLGLAIAQVMASYKPEWLVKIIGPNKRRNH